MLFRALCLLVACSVLGGYQGIWALAPVPLLSLSSRILRLPMYRSESSSARYRFGSHRTSLHRSLFDDDEEGNAAPSSRKFTGQEYFASSSSSSSSSDTGRGTNSKNDRLATPRERMQQREYNLVSAATSPAAFLFQAGAVLVLLGLIIYVGATGQLGMNNDYEDDYFNYDPDTVIVPESIIPESKESVWL